MLFSFIGAASKGIPRILHTQTSAVPLLELVSLLAFCIKQCKSLHSAKHIHQQILVRGLISPPSESSPVASASAILSTSLGSGVVSAYFSCGASAYALSVLEYLSPSPVFWWNMLIREDVKKDHLDHALLLPCQMQRLGVKPDHFTFPFILKACGELPSFCRGTAFHGVICRTGFESNVFVCNSLIAMYARCGAFNEATHVFDEVICRGIDDMISWNSMVVALVKSGHHNLALDLFCRMTKSIKHSYRQERSDVISLVTILPACASVRALSKARQIHCYALRTGLFLDIYVENALIDVYAKCGLMDDAVKVFNSMNIKDVVSWNAIVTGYAQNGDFKSVLELFKVMRKDGIVLNVITWSAVISGYAQQGHGHEALDIFRQMQLSGSDPNAVTIISLLSACASVGALCQGLEIHAHVLRKCLMSWYDDDHGDSEDLMVENALIDMYSKCKSFDRARRIFDSISLTERNVVTWTVMIGGYAQHGDANSALELFSLMLVGSNPVMPNAFTISCALMACARLSTLRFGKEIHAHVFHNRYDRTTLFVANCLIDMYSKCGDMDIARRVFNAMHEKNAVSWTSLMTGYGMHGRGDDALSVFKEMQNVGFVPDQITFLVVLYACSHSGMVDQGLEYFHRMEKDYGVIAGSEHYACVVDLLGRAGRMNDAWDTVRNMPMQPTSVVWVALLGACRVHANVELGEYASKRLLEIESGNDGSYTLLSNIYANAGRWKDVAGIRILMKRSGIKKRPGCSWVQSKKETTTFFAGDWSHPLSNEIYALLRDLIDRIKAMGYVPQTAFALHDVDDEEKNHLLLEHSEKLALAFGILTTPQGMPIRITKNLRICGDCHSAITCISLIVDREVILRDSSRFHHFKNGSCSCGGYW